MPYCPRCFDCDGDEPLLEPYICDNCWKVIEPIHPNIEIINHVEGLKAQLEEWLTIMSDDPHFAPPVWVMESMWTRLNLIQSLLQD